jgi:DNA-binding NarL/FixJ family response regulator
MTSNLSAAARPGVSERERDLLLALAGGRTTAAIARQDGVPLRRVQRELAAIRRSLGAKNSVNAVVIAVRRGII